MDKKLRLKSKKTNKLKFESNEAARHGRALGKGRHKNCRELQVILATMCDFVSMTSPPKNIMKTIKWAIL